MSKINPIEEWFKLRNPKNGAEVNATLKFLPHWDQRGFIVVGKTTKPNF
ncbi:hypothetical protein [Brevibacillus reuszeri]|nr:hypothetical protein [Brevibacillus reuszeri]